MSSFFQIQPIPNNYSQNTPSTKVPRVKMLNISHTGMAFDPESGDSFQLNESAKLILALQQQGLALEEITNRVAAEFNISHEQALTDVLEFQVQLKILGIAA